MARVPGWETQTAARIRNACFEHNPPRTAESRGVASGAALICPARSMGANENDIPTQCPSGGFAALMTRSRRPWVMLTLTSVGIYAATLWHPFFVDDYRFLRLMRDYAEGRRERLRLYEFVLGGDDTRSQREAGQLPWWAADDLRFTYFRPLSQTVLYAEYRLFGESAMGYRLVSLALYVSAVLLALSLYRAMTGDEQLSRWAALLFAVASSNAVPVVFIAAQCDVLALVLCLAAMRTGWRFIDKGGQGWAVTATLLYAAALLSKEAAVPAAVLPIGMAWLLKRGDARRASRLSGLWLALSLSLVAYYAVFKFGSNAQPLLNPLSEPRDYLERMPGRVVALLASWLIHVNPFLTYIWGQSWPLTIGYFVVGGAVLAYAGGQLWLRHRGERVLWAAAFWTVVFLPLLACTNPDNRILMLPMVGLSLCGALWLVGRSSADGAAPVLKKLPTAVLLIVPLPIGSITSSGMNMLEKKTAASYRAAAEAFARPTSRADFVFLLNTPFQFDLLWSQDRAAQLLGDAAPRVCYLSHLPSVRPERLGPNRLRLHAVSIRFFDPFLGRTATTHTALVDGMTFDAGEFTATLRGVRDNLADAVDFEFRRPLDSPEYRFFTLNASDPPTAWKP